MHKLVAVVVAISGLALSSFVPAGVTPAFAKNYGWVPGTHHRCYYDNKRHTIESCRGTGQL
jgi:hypothetical protein